MTARYRDIPTHRRLRALSDQVLEIFPVDSEWYDRIQDVIIRVTKAEPAGVTFQGSPGYGTVFHKVSNLLSGVLMPSADRGAMSESERNADTIDYMEGRITDDN